MTEEVASAVKCRAGITRRTHRAVEFLTRRYFPFVERRKRCIPRSSASLNLGVVYENLRLRVRFLISTHPALNYDKLDVTSSCFSFGPLRRSAVARY